MEINLIKSSGLSKEVFTQVMDLLQSIDGPLQFTCDPASVTDFSDDEIEIRRFDHPEDFSVGYRLPEKLLERDLMQTGM